MRSIKSKKLVKYNFSFLLLALIFMLVASPLFEKSLIGVKAGDAIAFIILFASIYNLRKSKLIHIISLLFVMNIGGNILSYWCHPENIYIIINACCTSAALLLLISLEIIYILIKEEVVRIDTVVGGICAYLLISAFWAMLYSALELMRPGSFDFTVHVFHRNLTNLFAIFNYFSLTTILTIGLGDIIPMTNWAQKITVLEGVVGQFYIVFFVSSLVAMYVSDRLEKNKKNT